MRRVNAPQLRIGWHCTTRLACSSVARCLCTRLHSSSFSTLTRAVLLEISPEKNSSNYVIWCNSLHGDACDTASRVVASPRNPSRHRKWKSSTGDLFPACARFGAGQTELADHRGERNSTRCKASNAIATESLCKLFVFVAVRRERRRGDRRRNQAKGKPVRQSAVFRRKRNDPLPLPIHCPCVECSKRSRCVLGKKIPISAYRDVEQRSNPRWTAACSPNLLSPSA